MKSASLATASYALFACVSILHLSSGQYDWDCNHLGVYTVDVCYQFSTSFQYLFKCNTTDSMVFTQYSDGSCGETDAESIYSVTYWESTDTYDLFQCDQDTACDYVILRYYEDEDCSGDSYWDNPFVTGQCYSSSSTSFTMSCGAVTLTIETYTTATDCTGSSVTSTSNYEEYTESITGCYQVAFEFSHLF